jgi:cytochrome d ubiquinol oxidase subunit I
MTDVLAARSQMAMSLAFHIIFAVLGIGMPALMVLAEHRWHTTADPLYLDLAKRWAKGTAILFAVGAVSGTVLSFELSLLWPGFMKYAGAIIGMPFSLEGFAFFTEAIFLGLYLYGWDRISHRAHIASGMIIAVSGAASGIFVVIANAWMNTPGGFHVVNGVPTDVHPFRAMMPAAILQPISGDISGRYVADWQPTKLAAMEGQFETERGAPLRIGGIPDESTRSVRYSIEIPGLLSFMAYHDFHAVVRGLNDVSRDLWPPVAIVHIAFQIMVGLGTLLALVALWALWCLFRRHDLGTELWLLRAVVVVASFGFLCIEAGWTVTEVGRQPWIVYGFLRTADAVTPMPGLIVPFITFTLLYCVLGVIVVYLLYQQVIKSPRIREGTTGARISAAAS